MKAERRHELQHNELADWVADAVEWIKPYSRAIVGVVVAATVLIATYYILSSRREQTRADAWTDFYLALESPRSSVESELEAVVREYQSVAAGRWAQVTLADLQLGEGVEQLFNDKRAATKKLESAVGHYKAALESADDALLIARARFGLGRAQESLGNLDKAAAAYEEVVNASGTNAYVDLAKTRLADLKRDSTRDFYAWFAKQEPVALPPDVSSSLPGTPGLKPPFDASSLSTPGKMDLSNGKLLDIPPLATDKDGPSLTLPAQTDDKKGEEKKEPVTTDAAKESTKQDGEAKANDESTTPGKDAEVKEPAAKEAADDTPVETPKPADEKSADAPPQNSEGAASDDAKNGQSDAKTADGG